MYRALRPKRYELNTVPICRILPFCVIFAVLYRQQKFNARVREQIRAPPLRIHRKADGKAILCVVPNVFQCGNPSSCGGQPLFVPDVYARFAKDLSDCFPKRNVQYYSGRAPKAAKYAQRYDADVLGQSFTSDWYHHFPHLAVRFPQQVLAPASFLLPFPDARLPTPTCLYPGEPTNRLCENGHHSLQPRILISKHVLGKPGDWVYEMMKLVTLGAMTSIFAPQFLHVSASSSDWESFRTLITSPRSYEIDRYDRLMRIGGISREPKCTRRVVIVTRDKRKKLDRTIPDSTLRKLNEELRRYSNSTIETVVDMGHLTFPQQVKLMQNTDVVVVVHGAEMSNTLFLRPGATVVEIHPFGYWMPNFFRSIREAVHLNHVAVSSPPDRVQFLACMKASRRFFPTIARAIRIFESRLKMYHAATDDWGRWKAGAFLMSTFWARRCCRAQIIDFDATEVALLVMGYARSRCNTTVAGR